MYRHKALMELAAAARNLLNQTTYQLKGMMPEEQQALEALHEERNKDQECKWEDTGNIVFKDILDGTEQPEAFNQQLPALTQAYLDWSYTWAKERRREYFPKSKDGGGSATSWTLHVINSWLIALVTICLRQNSLQLTGLLQWDSEDWHLKHACAACTYKLTDPFSDEDPDTNPCAGQWKNMDDAKTRKAWGIYDKTGIFIAVCCHRTCLLIADMVQSGECAKYPLVVISKLMTAFGDGLGGLGLEDLETCEHTFSKSNALASIVQYSTAFRQQQAINAYFEHNDHFEVYVNLTNFLFNSYKQALTIIHDSKTILLTLKHDLSINDNDSIFYRWLEEYWQRLGEFEASSQWLQEILDTWNLLVVQELEHKLNISHCWVLEDKEWQNTGRLVANREYCCALDNLKSLVVVWLFKLTKMNRAGTDCFLHTCEEKIGNIYPALAHQVSWHCKLHLQFNGSHLKRLHDIAMLPGFSSILHPGESALKGLVPLQPPPSHPLHGDTHKELEEEEDAEHEVEEASHALQDVLETLNGSAVLEICVHAVRDDEHGGELIVTGDVRTWAEVELVAPVVQSCRQ
ncbi:hypothetical protein BKA83DRAFT_4123828 [Pisolithus microcarpus]|nr:hypothetical protein BKA83DRAFT_4123828 [Pisolithus microcarpus]